MPSDFSVLEDGSILLCDMKEQRIVLYRNDGSIAEWWKKNGQGPGEFLGAWYSDYEKPLWGIFDSRQIKLLLYQREDKDAFKWIRDIKGTNSLTWDVKIYKSRVYYDASHFVDGKKYCIYSTDLDGKAARHYLPGEIRYGLNEGEDYRKVETPYAGKWGLVRAHLYIYKNIIYSAWIGDLKIIKINIDDGKWARIGVEPKYYKKPYVDPIGNVNKRRDPDADKAYSWVTGLFVDKDKIALLINNYNKKEAKWNVLLQVLSDTGVPVKTEILEGIAPSDRFLYYCYSSSDGCLYVLSEEDEGDEPEFYLFQYRIDF